jgi:hypothetical protein
VAELYEEEVYGEESLGAEELQDEECDIQGTRSKILASEARDARDAWAFSADQSKYRGS